MLRTSKVPVFAMLFALLTACGEDPTQQATPDASASAGKSDELGGRIDEAVKGLATSSAGAVKGDPNQPPPNGIFPPGLADKALPAGAPPKLELLGEGEDPKIVLHAAVPKGNERVTMLLQMALGGKPLPPLLLGLDVGPASADGSAPPAPAPAGSDKPAEKPAPAPGGSAAAQPSAKPADLGPAPTTDQPMVATVSSVTLPGMEDPPKELIDALKGAVVRFTMTKTGPTGFSRSLPKETEAKLAQTLDLELSAVEDAFTAMYTPAPTKPVGQNGYWMVTDRRKSLGAEIIRYRVFTVSEIQGDNAILSVQIKQYMVDEKSELTGFVRMESPVVVEYETDGKAAMQIGPGSRFPKVGQLEQQIQTVVIPAAAKGNPQAPRAELAIQIIAQTGPIELKPQEKGKPGAPGAPGAPKEKPKKAPAPPQQ